MSHSGLFSSFRVQAIRRENLHTCTIFLDSHLDAIPGQFVMAWLPGKGEKPFSISGNDPLALTVCDVGPLSHALGLLNTGNQLWVRGPLGRGFALLGQAHILVGGGYGAAPLFFLAKQARELGHEVSLCLGAKTQSELILVDEFLKLGCKVLLSTEDGSAGQQGLVSLPLLHALERSAAAAVYACGPTGMLLAVRQLCRQFQVPTQLSFEALIRCGVGLCGACELSEETCNLIGIPAGFLVCHDGPVVLASD